jgi:tetratricopeptide (TPR) repeat protein
MPMTMKSVNSAAGKWAGHMRRGAQLRSEKDYLAALALVPELAERKLSLIKTLRGLADLYAENARLEDAALLLERISQEASAPTRIFWCDYARLLFRLAEQQLRNKQIARANSSLEKVRGIAQQAQGHAEMEALCREGWLAIGTLFEQAGDWVPAELYFGRALEIAPGATAPDALQIYAELAWRAYWRRDFERCDHWALRACEAPADLLHPKLGHPQARAAAFLGALGSAAAQNHLPKVCDHFFEWARKILNDAAPSGSVELADLLVAWGSCAPNEVLAELRFQEALNLREQLLGENHPKSVELRQALGLGGESGFKQGFEHPPAEKAKISPAFKTPRAASVQELKVLQRRLVKLAHPDQAQDDAEFELRNKMMIEINDAATRGDGARLLRLASQVREALQRHGWLRSK